MRTISALKLTDIRVQAVTAAGAYYLRFYTDGTFDVFAIDKTGQLIALAGVGLDGAIAGSALAARRDAFVRDYPRLGP